MLLSDDFFNEIGHALIGAGVFFSSLEEQVEPCFIGGDSAIYCHSAVLAEGTDFDYKGFFAVEFDIEAESGAPAVDIIES